MIFMFPGVGDHYVDMGKGLYQSDDTFKRVVDECCDKVARDCGVHIKEILYPELSTTGGKTEAGRSKLTSDSPSETKVKKEEAPPKFDFRAMMNAGSTVSPAQQKMNETKISQPVVFIIEYALAMMWMSKGVYPEAMIGYSIGEYVAAVLSGVMSIDDALMLVTKRAQLIDKLPMGAMLAVPLSEEEVQKELIGSLAVAVRSTPNQTVVAGELNEIEELEKILRSKDIVSRKLQSTHAFHTAMLQSLHIPLLELVDSFELKAPKTPFISNLSGTWITEKEATDPSYWARHTWQKVDFSNGMGSLLEPSSFNGNKGRIFLEVGPGISLGSFMLQHPNAKQISNKMNMASMRTMYEGIQDEQYMLQTLGKIYLTGYTFSKNHKKGD
jgi:acyl transferase domain-containing protein